MGRDPAPAIEEVLGGHHPAGQARGRREGAQGLIQPPFIGLLVLEPGRTDFSQDRAEVLGEALAVVRIADPEIPHTMTSRAQVRRQPPHPGEDRDDFLRVVDDVVGLGPDFHQHIDHGRVDRPEPGVLGIELVAKEEPNGGHAPASPSPPERQMGDLYKLARGQAGTWARGVVIASNVGTNVPAGPPHVPGSQVGTIILPARSAR